MDAAKKIALLRRLITEANQGRFHDRDDSMFAAWKRTVERTLASVFGTDSPEVEEFTQLRFCHRPSIMALGADHTNEHRRAFQRDFRIAISSIETYIHEFDQCSEHEMETVPTATSRSTKLFVSHATADKHYVEELLQVLNAIGIPDDLIFCTSFEGHGIPLGKNFLQAIKDELRADTVVLFVLTPNFYGSPVCLCEMGAAWGLSKEHIPIVVPPFEFANIAGVIPLTQGFKINEPLQLNLFKEKLEHLFDLSPGGISPWERKRDAIVASINEKIAADSSSDTS